MLFVVGAGRGSEGRTEEQIYTFISAPLPTPDVITPALLHTAKRLLKSNKLNFICSPFLMSCKLSISNMKCLSFQKELVPSRLSDSSWFFHTHH